MAVLVEVILSNHVSCKKTKKHIAQFKLFKGSVDSQLQPKGMSHPIYHHFPDLHTGRHLSGCVWVNRIQNNGPKNIIMMCLNVKNKEKCHRIKEYKNEVSPPDPTLLHLYGSYLF